MGISPSHDRSIILPASADAIEVPPSSISYLRAIRESGTYEGKLVLGIYDGRGVLALGPARLFHVKILDFATNELDFDCRIVTSVSPNDTAPIKGALIQGAHFKVTNWEAPTVQIHRQSDSFGPFQGELFGRPAVEVVNEVFLKALGQC